MQWELLAAARAWADEHGLELVGGPAAALVLDQWEEVLTGLETDPSSL